MLAVRPAASDDSADLRRWRNDPVTVAMSVNSKTVEPDEHQEWFSAALNDPLQTLFIGVHEGTKVGVCRFQQQAGSGPAEVSINLDPELRGKGLAALFLQQAIDAFLSQQDVLLTATIKHSNVPSQRLFSRCGFRQVGRDGQCGLYERAVG